MRTPLQIASAALLAVGVFACVHVRFVGALPEIPAEPGESHLTNIRQLTNGGENAESYFSADGKKLIFQSTRDGRTCDQEYVMNIDGSGLKRISTGTGKTTCGFFYANDSRVIFGSSHA